VPLTDACHQWAGTEAAVRNLYSSFLLGTILICSGLFYGLALTNSDKRLQAGSSVLDGTWRLIQVMHRDANGQLSSQPLNSKSIKIIANQYFSTVTTDEDGRVTTSIAGMIEVKAGICLEYIGMLTKTVQPRQSEWHLADGRLTQRQHTSSGESRIEIWQLVE